MNNMNKIIKCCIFDLGGTIVDKYSITPIISMQKLFTTHNISLSNNFIQDYLGIEKKKHIELIMENKEIRNKWEKRNKESFTKNKLDNLFLEYKKIEKEYTINNMKIIPQTWRCMNELQNMGIKIGSTTGFDKEQVELIKYKLESGGVYLDNYEHSSYENNIMRPYGDMIFKNMDILNIEDPKSVLKIDDTEIGIREGNKAGCWTVGVYRWSTYMNVVSHEESLKVDNVIMGIGDDYNTNYNLLKDKKIESKERMTKTGANFIFPTVGYIPNLINDINNMNISLNKKYII